MARKTKNDWFHCALQVLTESSFLGLTIDTLTTKLGVTKGSFYHHFKDYEEFKIALMDSYEQVGTLRIIELAEEGGTPREKLKRLIEIVTTEDLPLETPIRVWAHLDPLVRGYQTRIDAQRRTYMEKLFFEILHDEVEAVFYAEKFYSLLVGAEQQFPPLSVERLRAQYDQENESSKFWD